MYLELLEIHLLLYLFDRELTYLHSQSAILCDHARNYS